ncbi:MAG: ABC transporter permease subunit [Ignavibacteriae bacterium]|nr:ABC transporter permease subunit [Ignavibacteriota bacterium]
MIIPTFIGITLITFLILQVVPGGPLEMELMKLRTGGQSGEVGTSTSGSGAINIPESALKEMKEFYGFDKPILIRYFNWLGNLLRFDFGKSYVFAEPVWDVIASRFKVSYLICVPLGVVKAVKNGSKFDFFSSFLVFLGYSTPGWAFGALMLILFGGGSFWNVFPLDGFRSADFDSMNFFQQVFDQLHHTILPVIAFIIGNFATLTILTKNSVIENLSQDYVKTAFSKGLSEKRVIYYHALRNSLIPIVTGIGAYLGLILTGSILIEKVFNIQGMGLLAFNSIINRDYPVTMGILVIYSVLMLFGNILSDMIYAWADPRIRFK